jgi:segregation and condensation protein B
MKPVHVVEAALFSAGRPLAIEEIVERTQLRKAEVEEAVVELKKAYEERDSVLEVGKAGTKWAMQVRSQAAEPAAKFAPMEIAEKLLKTLALIAYHQPMKQSELSDMIGSKVYDHVRELQERGLIKARQDGVTKILTTTASFPEYFGLDAATPDEIRVTMGRLVGIEAPPKRKEKQKLEAFAGGPESAHDAGVHASSEGDDNDSATGATPSGAHEGDSGALDSGHDEPEDRAEKEAPAPRPSEDADARRA